MKFAVPTAALVACLGTGPQLSSADAVHRELNSTRSLTDTASSSFFQMCGVGIFVQENRNVRAPSPVDCGVECQKTGCGTAMWLDHDGGTCSINDEVSLILSTNILPMADAASYFHTASPMPAVITIDYQLGMDMAGNDLTSTRRRSIAECVPDCMDNVKCFAVTWTDYEGGTCWLKKRASGYGYKQGADTFVFARAVTTPTACP